MEFHGYIKQVTKTDKDIKIVLVLTGKEQTFEAGLLMGLVDEAATFEVTPAQLNMEDGGFSSATPAEDEAGVRVDAETGEVLDDPIPFEGDPTDPFALISTVSPSASTDDAEDALAEEAGLEEPAVVANLWASAADVLVTKARDGVSANSMTDGVRYVAYVKDGLLGLEVQNAPSAVAEADAAVFYQVAGIEDYESVMLSSQGGIFTQVAVH